MKTLQKPNTPVESPAFVEYLTPEFDRGLSVRSPLPHLAIEGGTLVITGSSQSVNDLAVSLAHAASGPTVIITDRDMSKAGGKSS